MSIHACDACDAVSWRGMAWRALRAVWRAWRACLGVACVALRCVALRCVALRLCICFASLALRSIPLAAIKPLGQIVASFRYGHGHLIASHQCFCMSLQEMCIAVRMDSIHMRTDMRTSIRIDLRRDVCSGLRADTCVGVNIDVCICAQTRSHICELTRVHDVHRHAQVRTGRRYRSTAQSTHFQASAATHARFLVRVFVFFFRWGRGRLMGSGVAHWSVRPPRVCRHACM